MSNFDPYDALIELNERLLRLETAHNNLARAYEQSQLELNEALDALLSLQKSHVTLSNYVSNNIQASANIEWPK